MKSRECGECTACCEGWVPSVIEGRQMMPGKPCQHCTATGCAIYERRPQEPCRNFVCVWLQDDSPLAEDMRPDRAGAIVMMDRKWSGREVIVAVPTGTEIPRQTLETLMALARERSIPLMFRRNEFSDAGDLLVHHYAGYGPPRFVEKVKQQLTDDDIFRL